MGQIKIGIVGLGNMGMTYAKALLAGLIPAARLTTICVNGTAKAEKANTCHHGDSSFASG